MAIAKRRNNNASIHQQAQAQQLATVLAVNRRLALGPRLDEILAIITQEAAKLVQAPAAGIRLVEGDMLVRVARFGFHLPPMGAETIAIDNDEISRLVVRENRSTILDDIQNDSRFENSHREAARRTGMRRWLGVPLRGGGSTLGMLMVLRGDEPSFTQADVRLMEAFADQAAIAIENARLLASAERRALGAMAIAEVGRALTSSLELQTVLDLIVDQALRLADVDRSALAIADTERQTVFRFLAYRGFSEGFLTHIQPSHQREGTTAQAITERRTVWTADILADPLIEISDSVSAAIETEGYRAVLSIPLLIGDRVLGALAIYRDTVGPFLAETVDFLEIFAGQAALAIENSRLFHQEQVRRRQLEIIRDVTAELTGELDVGELLDLIVRRAADLIGGDLGAIYLLDESGETLIPRAWHNAGSWIADMRMSVGEGLTGAAVAQRRGFIVDDYRGWSGAHAKVLAHGDARAVIVEPILYKDRPIGAISIGRISMEPRFTDQDGTMLRLFADQAAIAIQNAHLFEQTTEIEALNELSRLKSEFLNTMSHELRTPLSLIHGYAELLVDRAKSMSADRVIDMATEIYAGSQTMARLVDDLLDFSRLEQGRLQLSRRRVDTAELLRNLTRGFQARPGGQRVSVSVAERLDADVDPDRLSQIVNHLVSNALCYALTEPIGIRAEARDACLMVEVIDHGPGVPPLERNRIWERFYRGERVVNSPTRGSGLGLALVKHLAELHGGEVGLHETPGGGATFWVRLPIEHPRTPS